MRKKQFIVDIIIDELVLAYEDDYYFDEDKFNKLSQENIDYICTYLIHELNVFGVNYERYDVGHFDTFDVDKLIFEVVWQWKSEIVEPDTYPKEKGFKGVDRFMKDYHLDNIDIFYGGGWSQVVKIYESNMGKTNICGFFY